MILSEFKNKNIKYGLTILVFLLSISITIIKLLGYKRQMDWGNDIKYEFYKSAMYKSPYDVRKIYKHLSIIPKDATVSMSDRIIPHLAFRRKPYFFPMVEDAEYIALIDSSFFPLTRDQYNSELNKYKSDSTWSVIVHDPPLLILKKRFN